MSEILCYHPEPEIDMQVRQDAAAAARADLAAGLPCTCCPVCGCDHGRGYLDGVDVYRCLHCGITVSPREWQTAVYGLIDDEV